VLPREVDCWGGVCTAAKGVASMRQDEANASSCFRGRQIFAHLFHDKALINIQVATQNTINVDVSRYYNNKHSNNL